MYLHLNRPRVSDRTRFPQLGENHLWDLEVQRRMKTFELHLRSDDIQNLQDKMLIERALSHSPGIDLVEVDIARHEVRVTTANQDGGVDVLRRLEDNGFTCEVLETASKLSHEDGNWT